MIKMRQLCGIGVALLMVALVLGTGCTGAPADNATPVPSDDIVEADGIVKYIDLEGGFYGIVAEDGSSYLPTDLNETYKVDGTAVTFTAREVKDAATVQMWGTPVEIITITVRESSAGLANPAAVYCDEMGYDYDIRKDAGGNEYGICIFPNGTEMDVWDLYRAAHPAE